LRRHAPGGLGSVRTATLAHRVAGRK
jgi:hypothetical protein